MLKVTIAIVLTLLVSNPDIRFSKAQILLRGNDKTNTAISVNGAATGSEAEALDINDGHSLVAKNGKDIVNLNLNDSISEENEHGLGVTSRFVSVYFFNKTNKSITVHARCSKNGGQTFSDEIKTYEPGTPESMCKVNSSVSYWYELDDGTPCKGINSNNWKHTSFEQRSITVEITECDTE